jgi:hypothetical protein
VKTQEQIKAFMSGLVDMMYAKLPTEGRDEAAEALMEKFLDTWQQAEPNAVEYVNTYWHTNKSACLSCRPYERVHHAFLRCPAELCGNAIRLGWL